MKSVPGKQVIRLYDGRWESLYINNEIAKFIIENGYGYKVETVELTSPIMKDAFKEGKIDANLEMWQQNTKVIYDELMKEGIITNLGMIYENGPQFWIIPKWVAQEYKIKTVFDMKAHKKLFRNPAKPTKGVFYNSIMGWSVTEINTIKMEAYGLDRYYDIITPGSEAALEAALERGQEQHQPVFGYYWSPTPLMGAYDWYILEEPPYSEGCWEKIMSAVRDKRLRPLEGACAYQDMPVDKIVRKDLLKRAPEVTDMLRKMVVGLEPLNKTAAWGRKHARDNWEKAALYYLQNYKGRWKTWVTPEACHKIEQALTLKENRI